MVNQMKTHNYLLFRNALSKIADPDVNNWKHVKSIKPTQIILNKDRSTCMCGHYIEYPYYICHKKYTHEVVVCGSTCIKAFMGKYILKPDCMVCGKKMKRVNKIPSCTKCRQVRATTKKKFNHLMKVLGATLAPIADKLDNDYKRSKGLCIECEEPLNNKKFERCYNCTYKKCHGCEKRNVRADSKYRMCYVCHKNSTREIRRRILLGC